MLAVASEPAAAPLVCAHRAAKPRRARVLVGRADEASSLARNQVTGTNDSGQRPRRQRYTQHPTTTAAGLLHGAKLSAGAPAAARRRRQRRRDAETCCAAEGRHARNALKARATVYSLVFPPTTDSVRYTAGQHIRTLS